MAIAEKYLNPWKLDDGLVTAFGVAIGKVHTITAAAALCDISQATVYRWLDLAKQDESAGKTPEESIYIRLQKAIELARAKDKERMLNVIKSTAENGKNWLPAAWFLERTDPDNFGRRDRHDVNLNETKEIRITRVEVVLSQPQQVVEADKVTPQQLVDGDYHELTNDTPVTSHNKQDKAII
jgi:transposase-like protein